MPNSTLERARANYEYARKLPFESRAPGRWDAQDENVGKIIEKIESADQALAIALTQLPFTHLARTSDEYRAMYDILLAYEFPPFIEETRRIGAYKPHTTTTTFDGVYWERDGVKYNNMYFWHLRSLWQILKFVPKTSTVLEIGGGYGNLARLWLHNKIRPVEKYIIVDHPFALYFAECSLGLEFSDIGYFRDSMPDTRIVLVPVANLRKLTGSSDIVVNIGSFQEMSDDWVSYYMNWLDEWKCNWLYSMNYCGSPVQEMAEGRSFWSSRPSKNWSTKLIDPDPVLVKLQCAPRTFAEMLYEHVPATENLGHWSVKRGRAITRSSYVEGLELVRQGSDLHQTIEFVNTIVNSVNRKEMFLPKEIVFMVHGLEQFGVDVKVLKSYLNEQVGNYLP